MRQTIWGVLISLVAVASVSSVYGVLVKSSPAITVEKTGEVFHIVNIQPGSEVWYSDGRVGDTITKINDQPAASFDQLPDHISSIELLIGNNESPSRIAIGIEARNLISETISLFLLAIAFSLMSLFVFMRAERTSEVALFALFTAAAATALAIGPGSLANHAWARLAQGASITTTSIFFFAFFLTFARDRLETDTGRSSSIPELASILVVLFWLIWIVIATFGGALFPTMRVVTLALLSISLLTVLVLLPWRYRRASMARKEQLRIATVGTLIGIFPFLWLSIIPQIVTGKPIVAAEASVLGLALIPLSFGYSILRFQLLGISRLIHQSATYVLITAGIIAAYGSALTVLNLITDDDEILRNLEVVLFFSMFAGVPLISGVRNRAIRIADRLLYPHTIERASVLEALNDEFSSSGNQTTLLEKSVAILGQGLGLRYAVGSTVISESMVHAEYGIRPVGFWYEDVTRNLDNESRVQRVSHGEIGSEYLVGSVNEFDGEPGHWILGPRIDGASFDTEDVRVFQLATNMISSELVRSKLSDAVEHQQRQLASIDSEVLQSQQNERAEISSYLHDEPLQKIAYALGQMRERSLPEDLAGILEEVAQDLRTTSASLSPDILISSGLVTAVGLAIEEQKNRSDFQVYLDVSQIEDEARFSEEIELAVYRTVQEGLNNVRKHAEAKAAWVQLSYDKRMLVASIDDNGSGISTIDSGARKNSTSNLGLRGLERRISQLGGTMKISARASRGTSLIVHLPATEIN